MAIKNIFRSAYDHNQIQEKFPKVYKAPTGTQMQNEYEYIINDFSQKVLKKTGERNFYKMIQEQLEDTKIENILKRVSQGDMSDFRPDGIYTDLTKMPSNMLEAKQMIQNLENTWNKLPKDIKEKYNYDVDQFVGQAGTDGWLEDMGLIPKVAEKVAEQITTEPAGEGAQDE